MSLNKVSFISFLKDILQPADVCWFKFLKNKYKLYWNDWFLNDQKTFTKHGNIVGPGYVKMTDWIIKAWLELDSENIAKSFKYCGINNENGSEFYSDLKKIYLDGTIPLNKTVEERTEDDDFNDVFDSHNSDDDDDHEPLEAKDDESDDDDGEEQDNCIDEEETDNENDNHNQDDSSDSVSSEEYMSKKKTKTTNSTKSPASSKSPVSKLKPNIKKTPAKKHNHK